MSLILQIETATATCSVALSEKGKTIAVKEESGQNLHAANITLFIQDVIGSAGRSMRELDAVAFSSGPGSYTGLRIGLSTAKGLCYALDIPLISVSTLAAMSAGALTRYHQPGGALLCPMVDARRMEVYTAVFNRSLEEIVPVNALIVDPGAFNDLLKEDNIIFFGDGAAKCAGMLDHEHAIFLQGFQNSAADLSTLAFGKFERSGFEDLAYFEPNYLKEFFMKTKAG